MTTRHTCFPLLLAFFESGPTKFWEHVSPVRYLAIVKSEQLFIARWRLPLILLWSCEGQSANHPRKAWWAPSSLSCYHNKWAVLHSEIAVAVDLDVNWRSGFIYQYLQTGVGPQSSRKCYIGKLAFPPTPFCLWSPCFALCRSIAISLS